MRFESGLSSLSIGRCVKQLNRYSWLLLGMVWFGGNAHANDVKLVELFTSQGCNSCPAADKLVASLTGKDPQILTLEFHVDYWDKLNHRNMGTWKDPFSSPEFTKRQRQYSSLNLAGENGVYTPQAVVNGSYALVGSNRRAMKKAVVAASSTMPVSVNIQRINDAFLNVGIAGDTANAANVYFVSFLKETETQITSGENNNKLMRNHNVVTELRLIGSLGELAAQQTEIAFPQQDNVGCAVLVQPASLGAILGVGRCP